MSSSHSSAVLGSWLGLLQPVSDAFTVVAVVGHAELAVWSVGIGVSLLRLREHAIA